MAFTVRGLNACSDAQASELVERSFTYLKRSALAKSILDDLEANGDVCIEVDTTKEPFYAHPESSYDTITTGGTAVWNPNMSVRTKDSKNFRPDAAWVPQNRERARIEVRKSGLALKFARKLGLSETKSAWQMVNAHKFGTLSTHMCLMHELGHALQYATCPDDFRAIKGDPQLSRVHVENALEETNLHCVEIPIALELNALGGTETPRWVYGHTEGLLTT